MTIEIFVEHRDCEGDVPCAAVDHSLGDDLGASRAKRRHLLAGEVGNLCLLAD